MTTVTYIISNINKSLTFEWIAIGLDRSKLKLCFILLNPGDSVFETYLKRLGIPVYRVYYCSKKNIPTAILSVYKILRKNKSDAVHAHFFEANIIGLTAAWLARVPKRIYTRHHSTFHHDYFPAAIKYDTYCNWLATDIIAITKNVENVLKQKEGVPHDKIHLIHHGFNLNEFAHVPVERINILKHKYNPQDRSPVIGVISRYVHLKGIQYIIPAFKSLLEQYPKALLVLSNARGDYGNVLKKLLDEIPKESFVEIAFEEDLGAFYKLFDVFVHVPINNHAEAFGQIYVESLASGIPSIFTISGVANEFIENKKNAIVVDYKNTKQIYDGIIELLNNKALTAGIITQGEKDATEFDIKRTINNLEKLYLN